VGAGESAAHGGEIGAKLCQTSRDGAASSSRYLQFVFHVVEHSPNRAHLKQPITSDAISRCSSVESDHVGLTPRDECMRARIRAPVELQSQLRAHTSARVSHRVGDRLEEVCEIEVHMARPTIHMAKNCEPPP
jgi:hypothetical protein